MVTLAFFLGRRLALVRRRFDPPSASHPAQQPTPAPPAPPLVASGLVAFPPQPAPLLLVGAALTVLPLLHRPRRVRAEVDLAVLADQEVIPALGREGRRLHPVAELAIGQPQPRPADPVA